MIFCVHKIGEHQNNLTTEYFARLCERDHDTKIILSQNIVSDDTLSLMMHLMSVKTLVMILWLMRSD